MEKKWNLQDIKPASRGREVRKSPEPKAVPATDMRRAAPAREEAPHAEPVPSAAPVSARRRRRGTMRKGTIFLVLGAVGILMLGFGASLVFGGAVVEVEPKQEVVTIDADFTAYAQAGAGELGYELLTLEATSERQVAAQGSETVSLQAEGTITIYNAYSDTPQRLIKNTRFESPDGLIYRVFESVEVPGRTEGENGEIVPGSTTARVFADAPGEEYNIGPSRFVVPGLRGTDQFESIYAESSEAFTGGFEGERPVIDDAELAAVQESLHGELADALRARLATERPAGFIVFDDAVTFEYSTLPSNAGDGTLATVVEQGKLVVPIFKEDEFASYIARNTVAGFANEPVMIESPETLAFAYQGTTTSDTALAEADSISFSLEGTSRIIWKFDEAKLKEDLRGAAKSALPTILGGYPAIEKAEAVIKPFWKQSFPENPEEITLKTLTGGE